MVGWMPSVGRADDVWGVERVDVAFLGAGAAKLSVANAKRRSVVVDTILNIRWTSGQKE